MNLAKSRVVPNASAVLQRTLVQSAVVLGVFVVIAGVVAWFAAGVPGVWGALLGTGLAGAFLLVTVAVVLLTMKSTPATTLGVVMGSWLVKMVLAFGLLMVLQPLDFYSKPTFFFVTAFSVVVVLVTESLAVTKTQAPYVDPVPSTGSGQRRED